MRKLFDIAVIFMICASCKEAYNPPLNSPPTGYLVIEGFINSNGDTSTITLTRTTKLVDSVSIAYEHHAQVNIESDNNESFPLAESFNGIYTSAALTLNSNAKYRVRINTTDGKQYLSEYAAVKNTPVIDSISWLQNNEGVTTYINTHDATGNVKYYRWQYNETWQIRSRHFSSLKFVYGVSGAPVAIEYRNARHEADTTILNCWQSYTSRNIILGTTEKLSADIIYLALTHIEPASIKLSVLYSIELKQYALSKGAYDFYQKLKKNTEQLGSIFDAQPSELQGNIQCTTDPAEIVIGYIDISQEQSTRIFINRNQLTDWNYLQSCGVQTLIENDPDSIAKKGVGLLATYPNKITFGIVDFYAAEPECVDCTLRGTNIKPSFWP